MIELMFKQLARLVELGADMELLEVRAHPLAVLENALRWHLKIDLAYFLEKDGVKPGPNDHEPSMFFSWNGYQIPIIPDRACPPDRLYLFQRQRCHRCRAVLPFGSLIGGELCERCLARIARFTNRSEWVRRKP